MNYNEPDFYDMEPVEFLAPYESELRDILHKAATEKMEEIVCDLKNVKKENERLMKENDRLKQIERNLNSKEKEIKNKMESMEKNFYKDKFSEIFKNLSVKGYKIDYTIKQQQKCDCCDENREIQLFSKDKTISKKIKCECSKPVSFYYPDEVSLYMINLRKNLDHGKSGLWAYLEYYRNEDEDSSGIKIRLEDIREKYTEENKDKYYGVFYVNLEDCQKHCHYLNKKENIIEASFPKKK